ncbi:chloride channel protein [Candidatus Methylomirabilis sp.]|uniref:chloride channel protein n=1 Tax=Candidatus Methylomirabilis sp. TaxID=2032687 RepID=UPI002A61C9DD|nr:chloride channel protein [Candidatus Methylomirabilis sp.]
MVDHAPTGVEMVQPLPWRRRLQLKTGDLLARLRLPQPTTQVLVAISVGIATGLGAVGFIRLLQLCTALFFDGGRWLFSGLGRYYVLVLPVLGGLLVGPLIVHFAREAKGHGVPEVMSALVLRGGRIRRRVALVKILASAITIGSGGSAGREGPMIQIGSSIGSSVAQWLRMPTERVRTLVACGAAGGVAATFNAPIAGAMFALEVLLGQFTADFSLVVLSAFAAAVVSRAMLGDFPAFAIPPWGLISEKELLFYPLLGVFSGLAATAFVKILYAFEDLFARSRLPEFLQPAVGGLAVGGIGLFLPQVFGTGLPTMGQLLVMQVPVGTMLALKPAKVLATSLTLGSGGSGGVFAPCLFIGGLVGGTFGSLVHALFPAFTASYGAYALVGMSATFGAAAQAPITAILILFEMTGDYHIILPLMSTTIIAVLLYREFSAKSIYTLKLERQGIQYGAAPERDLMAEIPVQEALTHPLLAIPREATIQELLRLVAKTGHEWFPVLDGHDELAGVVTYRDVAKAVDEGRLEDQVLGYATRDVVCAFSDDSLREVLMKFHERDLGHLPVVDSTNQKRLIGIISRRHVIRAYNRALARWGIRSP